MMSHRGEFQKIGKASGPLEVQIEALHVHVKTINYKS